MGLSRKQALRRVAGLARRVDEHLAKLEAMPSDLSESHWKHEIRVWISQVQDVLPELGRKTEEEWKERVAAWSRRLEG